MKLNINLVIPLAVVGIVFIIDTILKGFGEQLSIVSIILLSSILGFTISGLFKG